MAERLPGAAWTQRADLAQLVAALGADNMRWVGGAVRDTLLQHDVADIDVATPLLPDEVMERLKAAGIRCVPTGLDHGTVTAVLAGGPVEITTLRRDVATDGRRAVIAFASDYRDDAARRDFTINALYAHPETREISDYFGGLEDLSNRRIRFIGDAGERIHEDHLRILRYFRFQARFGAALDQDAERACQDHAQTLKGLSRERIAKELLLLLGLPDPHSTVARMFANGILSVILPETGVTEIRALAALIEAETSSDTAPDGLRRLAALLPVDAGAAGVADTVSSRLRLSRAQRGRLGSALSRNASDIENPYRLAYRKGLQQAQDRLLLAGVSPAPLKQWTIPVFPLKGGVLIERGIEPGPEVARTLRAIEARWIEAGFPDSEAIEAIEAILESELATRNMPDA